MIEEDEKEEDQSESEENNVTNNATPMSGKATPSTKKRKGGADAKRFAFKNKGKMQSEIITLGQGKKRSNDLLMESFELDDELAKED